MAMEPVHESQADLRSYGFRKFRNLFEAASEMEKQLLSGKWTHVLEGDIAKCFDEISHNWIIRRTP